MPDSTASSALPDRALRFTIEGMDCPTCAAKIERAVGAIPGVRDSHVNYGLGVLTVDVDNTVDPEMIARASDAVGHVARCLPSVPVDQHEWTVEGMDCADCVRTVESALTRLPGIRNVTINFTTRRLRLSLDQAGTPPREIVHTLRALGFTARQSSPVSAPLVRWYQTQKGRLVLVSGSLVVIAFALSFIWPSLSFWAYSAATLVAAWPVVRKAWGATRTGSPFDINTLVSVAALGSLFIGAAVEGALVVFLFAIGELLEGVATGRARQAITALTAMTPKSALLVQGEMTLEVPAESLTVGDHVRILPGGRVPADGVLMAGASSMNEAAITGEFLPTEKVPGAGVYAGSINGDGTVTVEVRKEAADTLMARIVQLVTEAEAGKSPTARFIDRFSRSYTPVVLLIAVLTAVVPPLTTGADWTSWIYKSLALLLIGCPCALVLSTPAAVTSAISAGARQGLLIKGGEALESLGKVKTIAFDKTGTLTRGEPRVTDVVRLGDLDEHMILALAAAVETTSHHPLGQAIVAEAHARTISYTGAADGRAFPGRGVTATVGGREVAVGSPRYVAEHGIVSRELDRVIAQLQDAGKTAVVLVDAERALGVVGIRDEPRPDARAGIAALRSLGIRSVMLTGDNHRTGQAIAGILGLDVEAELLPEEKVSAVRRLQKYGLVAMVGDGINDAPALATADVGIAMGGGTDVAIETASVALLRSSVTGVADLVRLSRATQGLIWQNIAFALGLKSIFLITTLLGLTNLWVAVLSDTGATALVTLNALRLLRFRVQPATGRVDTV